MPSLRRATVPSARGCGRRPRGPSAEAARGSFLPRRGRARSHLRRRPARAAAWTALHPGPAGPRRRGGGAQGAQGRDGGGCISPAASGPRPSPRPPLQGTGLRLPGLPEVPPLSRARGAGREAPRCGKEAGLAPLPGRLDGGPSSSCSSGPNAGRPRRRRPGLWAAGPGAEREAGARSPPRPREAPRPHLAQPAPRSRSRGSSADDSGEGAGPGPGPERGRCAAGRAGRARGSSQPAGP